MTNSRWLLALPILLTLAFGCASEPETQPFTQVEIPLKPGQVWTYRTRPGEEVSRVTVCLLEPDTDGRTIVHVAIDGLKLKNPKGSKGLSDRMGHMPLYESAFRASVRTLEGEGAVPAFNTGYEAWRESKGGAWEVPIDEALESIEAVLNPKK